MCARQAQEGTGKRAGASEEAIFKQKYRLENKQRRARKSGRENVCMCGCVGARVSVYVCECARARACTTGSPSRGAKNNPVREGAPPPPSCHQRGGRHLRVQPGMTAGGGLGSPVLGCRPEGVKG